MLDDVPRIVLGAVDERRFPTAEHRQADSVKARRGHDATIVLQPPLAVEHRYVEPAVVRLEARCPDDRANFAAREIEAQTRRLRHESRLEALGRPGVEIGRTFGPLVE